MDERVKLSFLFRQKWGDNVEFPSVCCEYVLLPMVSKEAALAYGKAEYSQAGNLNREIEQTESKRCHVATKGERCWNLTGKPQPHGDTQINRNGLQ